jgi:hypothetical protein
MINMKPHWVSDDAWFVYDDERFLGEVYRATSTSGLWLWHAIPHDRAEKMARFSTKDGAIAWIAGAP